MKGSMELVREFFRAPRDLWVMLGSLSNGLTLLLIAGVGVSYPPFSKLLQNFGEWLNYLWNWALPFEVSEQVSKFVTVFFIILAILARCYFAKYPSLYTIFDIEETWDETDTDFTIFFKRMRSIHGTLTTFIMAVFYGPLLLELASFIHIGNIVHEYSLYILIISISLYYPRVLFSLVWAIAVIFALDVAAGSLSMPAAP